MYTPRSATIVPSRSADARDRRDRESHARSRARVRGPGNPECLARVLVPQVVVVVVVVGGDGGGGW